MADWRALAQASMSADRFAHSERVARIAAELARAHGLDPERAALAGLLHDFAKEMGEPRLIALAGEAGLGERVPRVLHGPVAAFLLRRDHGLEDAGVLSAIARHTTGHPDMGPLDAVVYVADLASHGFEELRDLGMRDLVAATLAAMEITLADLLRRRRPVDAVAVCAWNRLLDRGMLLPGGG